MTRFKQNLIFSGSLKILGTWRIAQYYYESLFITMDILICNDDGYQSHGISLLARITSEFANVRVVAPERDRSAVSNSLTLDRPMNIRKAANGFYYVNGTPSDCVHLALQVMGDFNPQWVFSGINHGANMGDDTLYSGTVAAATEAYLLGIPAISFSLNDKSNGYWETAEKAVTQVIEKVINMEVKSPCLWNVNIPKVDVNDLQGIKITRLGRRHHGQGVFKSRNPSGEPVYWIGTIGQSSDNAEGTDFDGSERGFITITPLTVDLTDYQSMSHLRDIFQAT